MRIDIVCVRHPDTENQFTVFVDGRRREVGQKYDTRTRGHVAVHVHDLDLGDLFDEHLDLGRERPLTAFAEERAAEWRDASEVPRDVRFFCADVFEGLLTVFGVEREGS